MAQVEASTLKVVLAVAPDVPGSMNMAGSSSPLLYCVRRSQRSVAPDTLPSVKAGVAMATGVVVPTAPASSRKVTVVVVNLGPLAFAPVRLHSSTWIMAPVMPRSVVSQPSTTRSMDGATQMPVPRMSRKVSAVSVCSPSGSPDCPADSPVSLRSRRVSAVSAPSSAGTFPDSEAFSLRSRLVSIVSALMLAGMVPVRPVFPRSRLVSAVSALMPVSVPASPLLPRRSRLVSVVSAFTAAIPPVSAGLPPRSRPVMAASALMPVGIAPVSALSPRSRSVSAVSETMPASASVPVSALPPRFRSVSAVSALTSGTAPDSALSPRPSSVSAVRLVSSSGISPVSPMPERFSAVRPVSVPRAAGIVPVSPAFSERSRLVSCVSSVRMAGNAPCRSLSLRASPVTRLLAFVVTPYHADTGATSSRSKLPVTSAATMPVVQVNVRMLLDGASEVPRLSVFVPMRRKRPSKSDCSSCGVTAKLMPVEPCRISRRVTVWPPSVKVVVPLRMEPRVVPATL